MKAKKVSFSKVPGTARQGRGEAFLEGGACTPALPIVTVTSFFWLCVTPVWNQMRICWNKSVELSCSERAYHSSWGRREKENKHKAKQASPPLLPYLKHETLVWSCILTIPRLEKIMYILNYTQINSCLLWLNYALENCTVIIFMPAIKDRSPRFWVGVRQEKITSPAIDDWKKKVLTKLFFQNGGFNCIFFI